MKTLSITLLAILLLTLAGPVAAQDDGSIARIPEGPGFAIGAFDNGRTYSLAQTFAVEYGGAFGGAVLAFGEAAGTPTGAVRWEVRRWYSSIGYMGRLLACGAWEPLEMAYSSVLADVRLRPGTYALILRAVELQEPGNYWTVIATSGDTDVYQDGELLQLERGGEWGAWPGQDVAGVLDLVGPDVMFIELVG